MMRVLELDEAAPRSCGRGSPFINECAVLRFKMDTRHDLRSDVSDLVLPDHGSGELEATSGLHVSQGLIK